jgi:hypothetical protein
VVGRTLGQSGESAPGRAVDDGAVALLARLPQPVLHRRPDAARVDRVDLDEEVGRVGGRHLDAPLLPVNMISRGEEVAPEVLRLLPDLCSGALSLPYERYGTDALGEAVERLRTGAAVGKIVLDLGGAGN